MDNTLTPRMLMEARRLAGISQHFLAKQAKVSRYRITMFECEYGELRVEEIERILTCLQQLPAFKRGGVS